MNKKALMNLKEIDHKIDLLYEQKEKLVKKLMEKYGNGAEATIDVGGESPFMRVKLIDNSNPFSDEKPVLYRMASFRRYDVKIDFLKKAPKDKE